MTDRTYSNEDKLRAIIRELGFRERVYPRRVDERRMTQHEADRELGVMRAILADYSAKVEEEKRAGRLL